MNLRTIVFTVLATVLLIFTVVCRHQSESNSVSAIGSGVVSASSTPDASTKGSDTPVLVELFTSEGCSSCPPADALLSKLGRTQPVPGADVILLEEHVDYWDRLGWKDPFSSAAATARQYDYGTAFGGNQVYTPQMVVDGHAEFVGNSERDALRAIRAAGDLPKPAVHLTWNEGNTLTIRIEPLASVARGDAPQIVLAVTESVLHSDVKRGENAGRALQHDGVVRQLLPVGKIDNASSEFSSTIAVNPPREYNRANLRAVVFVQDPKSRRILAVSALPFLTS